MRLLWITPLVVCLATAQEITLPQALDLAVRQNPGIQVARLRKVERAAQADALRASYLPQVNATIAGAYQTNNLQGIGLVFPGFPSRLGPYRTFNARPVVSQTLLDFSLLSAIRAGRAETEAARHDVEAIREETQAAVITAYLQTFQAQSRWKAAQARLATAEALLKQAQDLAQGGAASQLDLARNRQRREAEQLTVITADQELRTIRPLLNELLGLSANDSRALAEPQLQSSLSAAGLQRPDMAAVDERIRAAEQSLNQARRQRWPKLTGLGDYGALGTGPDSSIGTFNVGATLQIPVWTSGRLESEIRAAEARLAQSREERRRLELLIDRQVAQAQIDFEAQTLAARTARESVAAARQVLELAKLRYASGFATSVDTVTAQSSLAEAEDAGIRAEYGIGIALARLAYARGNVLSVVR